MTTSPCTKLHTTSCYVSMFWDNIGHVKNELYDVLLFIYQANATFEKSMLIEQARLGITRVKIEIRLLHDLKQLSIKQYAGLSQMSESVSKQLAAWSKSQKNKQT